MDCKNWPILCVYFSHRPVDVCNVYNQVQVKLLMKEDELEDLPEYTDVFRDEDVGIGFIHGL